MFETCAPLDSEPALLPHRRDSEPRLGGSYGHNCLVRKGPVTCDLFGTKPLEILDNGKVTGCDCV